MNCQDYAAALLGGETPPAEALVHGRECPRCRSLSGLHASAHALRLAEPPASAPISYQAILGEVRRRQTRRRRVAGVGAVAALTLVAVFLSTRASLPRSAPEEAPLAGGVAVEGSAQIVQPSSDSAHDSRQEEVAVREATSSGDLLAEVEGYTHSSPGLEDAVYRPFGALPFWVHPAESLALESYPFQTALAAVAVSRSPRAVE